jgi:hypothetical protein
MIPLEAVLHMLEFGAKYMAGMSMPNEASLDVQGMLAHQSTAANIFANIHPSRPPMHGSYTVQQTLLML